MSEKNGNGLNLMKIGAGLAVGIPVIITLCTLVYRVGTQQAQVEHNTIDVAQNKNIIPIVDKLGDEVGIANTKIEDNSKTLNKVFLTENLIRAELQTLAETKLDKTDFYRYKTEMNDTLTKMGQRILYLERQSTPHD